MNPNDKVIKIEVKKKEEDKKENYRVGATKVM